MALRVVHKTSRVVDKIVKIKKSAPDKQALATEALSVRTFRRGAVGAVGKEERAERACAQRPTQHGAGNRGAEKFSEMRAERGAQHPSPTSPRLLILYFCRARQGEALAFDLRTVIS